MLYLLLSVPTCPDDQTFKVCGQSIVPTCEDVIGEYPCKTGCFCTDGMVLHEGKCMQPVDCQSKYSTWYIIYIYVYVCELLRMYT